MSLNFEVNIIRNLKKIYIYNIITLNALGRLLGIHLLISLLSGSSFKNDALLLLLLLL